MVTNAETDLRKLVGKTLFLSMSHPDYWERVGDCDVEVIAYVQDKGRLSEAFITKPKDRDVFQFERFTARYFWIGPMGGYKKEERPVMTRLLTGGVVSVAVGFIDLDDIGFMGDMIDREVILDKLKGTKDEFGRYGKFECRGSAKLRRK